MAEPHRLHGAHGATVSLSAVFANPVIFPPTHASTFPSRPLKAFTFSTPAKDWREKRGQFYLGLGKGLGRGSELRAGSGKISVCSPRGGRGRRGRKRKAAWTSKEPKQRQGREKQPVLGLPVLLNLALAALMWLLTQECPSCASPLLVPTTDRREQGYK